MLIMRTRQHKDGLMNYHSLSNSALSAPFSEALLASLAPDGGLYMPDSLPRFDDEAMVRLAALPFAECAARLAMHFVDDKFSRQDVEKICRSAYDFPLPVRTLDGWILDTAMVEPAANDFILELFHGPTLAFKDFAARFMGRAVSHLLQQSGESRTILVATSGDTGGAVGHAFLGLPGVRVYILFPHKGVSSIQEAQLTSMGGNVRAIKVDGTFDDCQALVKQAFGQSDVAERFRLMSANSINVGRVIPQSFYYFWTALQIRAAYPGKPIAFAIPSGNLGNLTGAVLARKMGAPIDRLVVGHNANHPFIDYLESGTYTPRESVPTLSNAMDIGKPNNFPRVLNLFDENYELLRSVISGAAYTDQQTERHIRRIYTETGYLMCPHTAVGHLAMQDFAENGGADHVRVTVSTAHPAKFRDEVSRILHEPVPLPPALRACMDAPKSAHLMKADLDALIAFLDETGA